MVQSVPPMAHHAPHRPAAKAAAAKPRAGHGAGARFAVILGVAAVASVAVWYWLHGSGKVDPMEQFLEQMQAAAEGAAAPTHAYGGALVVTRANGRTNVTAENLPSRACVQVGWRLAKEGTIIVNGTLPMRLSAAKLSELCSEGEKGATLTWVPED